MERTSEFLSWLIEEKAMQTRSARDVLSRCRRVERILDMRLEGALTIYKGSDGIIKNLKEKTISFLPSGTKGRHSLAQMVRAVRLFDEFSKLNHA